MNFGKIIKGYGSILLGLLTFSAIAGLCVIAGIIVVYPLWKLAISNTRLYTVISIGLFVCGIAYLSVKHIITSYKKNPRRLIISILKKIIIIGGIFVCFNLVLSFHTVSALVLFIIILMFYGFLAFGIDQPKNSGNESL